MADRVGDCSVFYRHTPTDQGWRRSEDWAGHRQVAKEMVTVLAGAVRAKLREQQSVEKESSARRLERNAR